VLHKLRISVTQRLCQVVKQVLHACCVPALPVKSLAALCFLLHCLIKSLAAVCLLLLLLPLLQVCQRSSAWRNRCTAGAGELLPRTCSLLLHVQIVAAPRSVDAVV
jgi:hypothetical protein